MPDKWILSDREIVKRWRRCKTDDEYETMLVLLSDLLACSKKDVALFLLEQGELNAKLVAKFRKNTILPCTKFKVHLPDDLCELITAELDRYSVAEKDAQRVIEEYADAKELLERLARWRGYITDGVTVNAKGVFI